MCLTWTSLSSFLLLPTLLTISEKYHQVSHIPPSLPPTLCSPGGVHPAGARLLGGAWNPPVSGSEASATPAALRGQGPGPSSGRGQRGDRKAGTQVPPAACRPLLCEAQQLEGWVCPSDLVRWLEGNVRLWDRSWEIGAQRLPGLRRSLSRPDLTPSVGRWELGPWSSCPLPSSTTLSSWQLGPCCSS